MPPPTRLENCMGKAGEAAASHSCHCEAEGRGNLLEPGENMYAVPGDHLVALLLAMTELVGIWSFWYE